MTDTYKDAIDIQSITQNWPSGYHMPELISQLGTLMSPWPWGTLGHWRLVGEAFDTFWSQWLKEGAALDGQFGLFMGFASGAKYAVWYHDDDPDGAHPVVYFPDDNRDISIVAPNTKAFFSQWASGTGIGWLEPFDYDATPNILAQRQGYGRLMQTVIKASPDAPTGLSHDALQARLTATCERAFAVMDEKDRQRRLLETYGDRIDLVSPKAFWPKDKPFPEPIAQLGALIKPWVMGSVGRYDMRGQHMPDTWFDHGSDLHAQFGFFLVDHRYREVAVWYHDGAVSGCEPIVGFDSMIFDSDYDAVVLAPNLKAYLTLLAQAVLAGDPTYGLNEEPEIVALRPTLASAMMALIDRMLEPPAGAPIPDLPTYIRSHIKAQRTKDLADPLLVQMKQILHARFPAPTEPLWNSIFATVRGGGFDFSLTGQDLDDGSFPEGAALTSLLMQARALRAQGPTRSLGPWTSAQLALHPDGRLALSAYWEN